MFYYDYIQCSIYSYEYFKCTEYAVYIRRVCSQIFLVSKQFFFCRFHIGIPNRSANKLLYGDIALKNPLRR